jgi:uncharacterized protein
VARGEDVEGSDVDIIVHPNHGLSYFDLGRLVFELQGVLKCGVDIGEDTVLKDHARENILRDARAI